MSKRKPIDEAPTHIVEWVNANPLAAADDFTDRVRQDACADVAMGRPIEDAQLIARGLAHDEGSRKDRGPRRPLLDDWLDAQLQKRSYSNDELFKLIPESEHGDKLYREGDKVGIDGQKRLLGRSGFDKRVTEARKRIQKPR